MVGVLDIIYCRLFVLLYAGMPVLFGGETKAHAVAQEQSWPEILKFLRKELTANNKSNNNNNSNSANGGFVGGGKIGSIRPKL